MRLPALILLAPLALTGCSVMTTTATSGTVTGAAITGKVHGGQQPIVGAHVYLMAANITGYGGPGIAPSTTNASLSLLTPLTGHSDAIGNYVLSDANGSFTITGDYTCLANQQVYLYALGGNPGAGTNPNAGLLASLGTCPGASFPATQNVWVNEVTTIAAAYSFAGFASDVTHVSSSGTPLAQTGIANAFANATNLVNPTTGAALATTPAGNGTVPQQELNTLANILASCINTNGSASSCTTLFANAKFGGSTGTVATDTATAAINIAHNPAANVGVLYTIPPPAIAFGNALTAQPNDFTMLLTFTAPALGFNDAIAIDAAGDAWITNGYANGSVVELSPTGAVLSGTTGFNDGSQSGAFGIAIDLNGSAWIANEFSNTVTKFSNSGAVITGNNGFSALYSLNLPASVAIDALDDAWVAMGQIAPVVEYSTNGVILSQPAGYAGTVHLPAGMEIDGAGSVWVANNSGGYISKFSSSSATLSGANGYKSGGIGSPRGVAIESSGNTWVVSTYTSASVPGGLTKLSNSGSLLLSANPSQNGTSTFLEHPFGIAIDGAGSLWVTDQDTPGASIVQFSSSAALLSPTNGFCSNQLSHPAGIAPDGSGNIWIADEGGSVFELIGAATPVITPIAAGLPLIPTADGSSNLGTRP